MREIKDFIYRLLREDAKISISPSLGYYLGEIETEPYGIYYINTPKKPNFPLIIFKEQSIERDKRFAVNEAQMYESAFVFTVYGKKKELILDRIFHLLDNYKFGNLNRQTATDYCIILDCKQEWESSDMFDENFGEYYRQAQYRVKFRRILI